MDARSRGSAPDRGVRALPNNPVFSDHARVRAIAGGSGEHADALSWARRFVQGRADALALMTWERCRAGQESSFSAFCLDTKWSRATAEDRRRRAADMIVRRLAAEQHEGLDRHKTGTAPSSQQRAVETIR